MTEILLEPDKFFARTRARPPRPWLGYGVAFLATLLAALAGQLAARNLPSPSILGSSWLWLVVGAAIGSLVAWGFFGFLFHLASGLGPRAFELAGWVYAPGVVLGLVLLATAALFPVEATLPPPPSDPGQIRAWLKAYQAATHAALYHQIARGVGVVGMAWGAWILYAGARVFAGKRAALLTGLYLAVEGLLLAAGYLLG